MTQYGLQCGSLNQKWIFWALRLDVPIVIPSDLDLFAISRVQRLLGLQPSYTQYISYGGLSLSCYTIPGWSIGIQVKQTQLRQQSLFVSIKASRYGSNLFSPVYPFDSTLGIGISLKLGLHRQYQVGNLLNFCPKSTHRPLYEDNVLALDHFAILYWLKNGVDEFKSLD